MRRRRRPNITPLRSRNIMRRLPHRHRLKRSTTAITVHSLTGIGAAASSSFSIRVTTGTETTVITSTVGRIKGGAISEAAVIARTRRRKAPPGLPIPDFPEREGYQCGYWPRSCRSDPNQPSLGRNEPTGEVDREKVSRCPATRYRHRFRPGCGLCGRTSPSSPPAPPPSFVTSATEPRSSEQAGLFAVDGRRVILRRSPTPPRLNSALALPDLNDSLMAEPV
jgi:hypothetical protein